MRRFWTRLAPLLVLLWLTPLFLIRSRPYDASGMVDFLNLQTGCQKPCFLGIQAGTMPVETALDILNHQTWVSGMNEDYATLRSYYGLQLSRLRYFLTWTWSDARPDWLLQSSRGAMVIENNEVQALMLSTSIPLGDVLSALGEADASYLFNRRQDLSTDWYVFEAWYSEKCLLVTGSADTVPRVYLASAVVYLQPQPPEDSRLNTSCGH